MKDTSAKARDEWSVLIYNVLNLSFSISEEFNDAFFLVSVV